MSVSQELKFKEVADKIKMRLVKLQMMQNTYNSENNPLASDYKLGWLDGWDCFAKEELLFLEELMHSL